jgi:hypothetical protein
MSPNDKDLVWLHGEVKTPPFSLEAKLEAGYLLRQLQQGVRLSMPQSRSMPSIGRRSAVDTMNCELTMRIAPGE